MMDFLCKQQIVYPPVLSMSNAKVSCSYRTVLPDLHLLMDAILSAEYAAEQSVGPAEVPRRVCQRRSIVPGLGCRSGKAYPRWPVLLVKRQGKLRHTSGLLPGRWMCCCQAWTSLPPEFAARGQLLEESLQPLILERLAARGRRS